jgi:hypothetical protein
MKMHDPGTAPLVALEDHAAFIDRHIGTTFDEQAAMLDTLGFASRAALIDAVVPASIREREALPLPAPMSEAEALARLKSIARQNRVAKSFIGQGYYGTLTPAVIQRNVLESPAWYTAYTPYQPEISQGRLEALVNFQDDGVRPDRHGDRELRFDAGRGDRGRGSDDAGAADRKKRQHAILRRG